MPIPAIQPAFSAGEWAPDLFGRVDAERYKRACSTLRNMFASYKGGAYSRAGTLFVGRCKQDGSGAHPRLIPFQFSVTQGYVLEFGDNYMRVIFRGGYVVDVAADITGATQADPCVLSVSGTPFADGDWVQISGVAGMTELNGQTFIVDNAASGSFSLKDLDGVDVDATGFGAYVSGGVASRIFTLATPYLAQDLEFLKYTQSADVMSLTHPNYPPFDLTRVTNNEWTLDPTSFSSTIAAPTNAFADTSASGSVRYAYVVTAIDGETGSESVASNIATLNSADISVTAGTITVTWDGVPGADSYNVYLAPTVIGGGAVPVGSSFGFIGRALGNAFADTNITPDFTKTPPLHKNPFAVSPVLSIVMTNPGSGANATTTVSISSSSGSGFVGTPIVVSGAVQGVLIQNGGENYAESDTVVFGGAGTGFAATLTVGPTDGTYPGVVSYFQQRRWYADTLNQPDTYFASKPGDYTNFDSSIPTVDDDAIIGTPWAQQINGVQFMLPMPFGLVVFTGNGSWQLSGGQTQTAVTPADQVATPQAAVGSSPIVPPIQINQEILFVQATGSIVRDLVYNFFTNIYSGNDITEFSSHLFQGYQLREWAWAQEPYKIIWAIRNDGTLLSDTWLKEQEVNGWARHDTQGLFQSVCVTTEEVKGRSSTGVPPEPVSAGYTTGAVHFDGATSLDLASLVATNSSFLTYSYWYRIAGAQNRTLWAVDPTGDSFMQDVLRTGPDIFVADEPYTGDRMSFSDANSEAFNVWHNVLVCMDVNHADGARPHSLWVDDVNVTLDDPVHSSGGAFTLTPNGFAFALGDDGFGDFVTMDFADFWWGQGQYIDFTVEANRRKFISATLKPVNLGTDGSTPTGTAPAMFLRRAPAAGASTFATDLSGHGNTLTITGALTDASSSPSD